MMRDIYTMRDDNDEINDGQAITLHFLLVAF